MQMDNAESISAVINTNLTHEKMVQVGTVLVIAAALLYFFVIEKAKD